MASRLGARRTALALLGLLACSLSAARAGAQADSAAVAADTLAADGAAADSAAVGPTPAGAFLRGAIVPGWGHAASGSLTRGAFYFASESLAGWMLFKTMRRLRFAREQAGLWERRATAELASQGVTDPEQVESRLAAHEQVARYRGLVSAREEQREDWLAVAIFTLLLSGVDAFVSTHLGDFPRRSSSTAPPTEPSRSACVFRSDRRASGRPPIPSTRGESGGRPLPSSRRSGAPPSRRC